MMHQFNQNQNLPVPCQQMDQSCLNNNLPQGNDRVPPVQLSQWLSANQQVGLMVIGLLRGMAQSAANKTQLHCFVYNLLAQNGFQNQVWQQWCQTAIDFCEFLVVVKGYQLQQAVNKAAQCTLESALGIAYHTYPVLQQVTPQQMYPGLQAAQKMYQDILNDVRNLRSGNFNSGMPNNWQGNNNLPPINVGQHHNQYGHQQSNYNNAQVNGNAMISNYQTGPMHSSSNTEPASGHVGNSLYDLPMSEPVKPLVPKEEISNDYFGNPLPQEPAPMQSFPQAQQLVDTDLPIPSNVTEVVVDPTYFQPNGFKLDINRAYDVIHNPGGIEIRPAQLVDWVITVGDDAPWPELMDPQSYCLFYVKFPDGTVKEKFVEWTNSMDYLRHELDAELRRKAYRPKGIVVSSSTPISTIGGDAIKADEVQSLVQDGHLKRDAVPPVVLPVVFQGATDLEVEMQVREELSNLLEVNFNSDTPMPAVEYRSSYNHPLPIDETAFEELSKLIETNNLGQIAQGLRTLTLNGVIPIRVLRVLNDRLTKAVNGVLTDGLCMTVTIDDFCEDYLSLEDYLEQNRGAAMRKVLQGASKAVINRALTITAADSVGDDITTTVYNVVDNYINHQVGWDLDDIATLNLKSGKATLISNLAHPVILATLKGMIARGNANKDSMAGVMRLITRDGYYLELIKGRLVENATLLKLVK